MKGLFITIEGTDGAGKTTQINMLMEYLKNKGREVIFTREPGGTAIGEKIRNIILDNSNSEMEDITEAFLYSSSRAQHTKELIKPAIEKGVVVVCDRYTDSSIAYQGFGRNLGFETVKAINDVATGGLQPDITIYLDLPPEKGIERKKQEKVLDRLENEKLEFHKRVYAGYEYICKMYPERVKRISADAPIEEIQEKIRREIDKII